MELDLQNEIQPFVLQVKDQSLSRSSGIQADCMFSPLKITNGGIELPSAQIHSTTVAHSCLPGSAIYACFSSVETIRYLPCVVPIAKPTHQLYFHRITINENLFRQSCRYSPFEYCIVQ